MPRPRDTESFSYTQLYHAHVQEAYDLEEKVHAMRAAKRKYYKRIMPNANMDEVERHVSNNEEVKELIADNKFARDKAMVYAPGMLAEQLAGGMRRIIPPPPRLSK